ncbi:MAG: hypothetical protein WCO22_01015 [Betaproteobacteria bacterium]
MKKLNGYLQAKNKLIVLMTSIFIHSTVGYAQESPSEQRQSLLTPENSAIAAAVADGLTTSLGLSVGAVEANTAISTSPIGLIALTSLKIGLLKFSDNLAVPEKRLVLKSASSVWGGAAINNIAVYMAAPQPIPIIMGVIMGVVTWLSVEDKYHMEDILLAETQKKSQLIGGKLADLQSIAGR